MRTTLNLSWNDLAIGQVFDSASRTITESDVFLFAGLTGDHAEHHTSRVVAAESNFGQPVAHGFLVLSCAHGLMLGSGLLRGSVEALAGVSDWRFRAPVVFGDTIRVRFRVSSMRTSKSRPNSGLLVFEVDVLNQHDEIVQTGNQTLLMSTVEPGEESVIAAASREFN